MITEIRKRDFSKIENVIYSGGGVRICGEIGAFTGLSQQGILPQIKKVGGTSAGSITATLHSVGYTAAEMTSMVDTLDFKTFEDGNVFDDINLITKYGIHPAQTFLIWMQSAIKAKTGNPLSTFADFKKAGFLELAIFATNLNQGNVTRFDYKNTPDIPVCYAVRCSMSIPLFFYAFQIPGHNTDLYLDGGCQFNYPITAFDDDCDCSDEKTLGLAFKNTIPVAPTTVGYFHFPKYIKVLLETILNGQDITLLLNPENVKRTIFIPTNVSTTDFGILKAAKDNLYANGLKAVLEA